MPKRKIDWDDGNPRVVGCFGTPADLSSADPEEVVSACDLVEIRLDLMADVCAPPGARAWAKLGDTPLLFTARRGDEGGAGALAAGERERLLCAVLDQATCVDVEVASIHEMKDLLLLVREQGVPWVASFHDFNRLPERRVLAAAANRARDAGAAVFKAAAMLHHPDDLARLADFQLEDHGIPKATMGMGALAAVSRLLCAQCGSVLNYGFLGTQPTAPGQWHAGKLNGIIRQLPPFRTQSREIL